MSDLEQKMLAHLEGKFFWEPSADPDDHTCKDISAIRRAQRAFSKGAKHITTRSKSAVCVNAIKPLKRVLKGEEKVIEPYLKAVAKVYDVAPDDILSRTTSPALTKAKRHFYWALMKYIPGMSLSEAGRLIRKNHSTVLHGVNTFLADYDVEKIAEVEIEMGVVGEGTS